MIVEKATQRDVPQILKIRNKNIKYLMMKPEMSLRNAIKGGYGYCIRDEENGNVICFCVIKPNKTFKMNKIHTLITDNEHQGKGLATILLWEVTRRHRGETMLEAVDGAPNNFLYDKVCDFVRKIKRGSVTIKLYIVNKEKLNARYERMQEKGR